MASDNLIYPVEGDPSLRQAPNAYVAFGRPKGYPDRYLVWEEGGIFPQVIIEVWSPHNRYTQMQKQFAFYEKYGAKEYYIVLSGIARVCGRMVAARRAVGGSGDDERFCQPAVGSPFRVGTG